ncbi:MAG: hypothetical protein HYT61_02880 [Candidatus Yanofskybacteria bacterium]|nr:hypothetical protein [Candidatus Yanofskybacteria bacterium]
MAHIIDLKNRQTVLKPENGERLNLEQSSIRVISWSGRLYHQPNRFAATVAAVIFFGIAVLIQIFQKNLITTVFFALIGAVILLNTRHEPTNNNFEINPGGISVNGKIYNYREIKSFWIEYDLTLGIKELSLQLKKWHTPYVKIPIAEQNPVQLRLALLEFLPEVEHKDTLVEILARKLGI